MNIKHKPLGMRRAPDSNWLGFGIDFKGAKQFAVQRQAQPEGTYFQLVISKRPCERSSMVTIKEQQTFGTDNK
jgi:hypothetical protein